MSTSRKRGLVAGALFVVIVGSIAGIKWLFPPRHEHCIKGALFELSAYAKENGGRFPESASRWADALLKLNHKMINDADWPQFVRAQRKLLEDEGFS